MIDQGFDEPESFESAVSAPLFAVPGLAPEGGKWDPFDPALTTEAYAMPHARGTPSQPSAASASSAVPVSR